MDTRNKTRKVAVYPGGRRFVIYRKNGMYYWDHGAASSHMSGVKDNLAHECGGHIETEPNPNYRPRMTRFEREMQRIFG